MASAPRFSIVTPTYNRAPIIADLVGVVLGQPFGDFELIVVNDGSTDDTADRVRAVADPRVRYLERDNGGISLARNTGAAAAEGEFLIFLDDDDRPRPGWLATLDACARSHGADIVSCACALVDAVGTPFEERVPTALGPAFEDYTGLFLPGTFAARREAILEVGGFAAGLQCSHVSELLLRLLPAARRDGWVVASTDEVVIDIERRHAGARPEASPEKLLSGVERMVVEHAEQLGKSPSTLADYHAIAGVSAFRLGRQRTARSHLWAALRSEPLSVKHFVRLGLSLMPPLGRRVWMRGPT